MKPITLYIPSCWRGINTLISNSGDQEDPHQCDPTVVIFSLTFSLTFFSYSLTYNLRIFQFGFIIITKLPSCDDIIHRTSLMMYGGLYQHTQVVVNIYFIIYNHIYN